MTGYDSTPPVLSVAALTRRIKAILEEDVGRIWVEGEVSNLHRSPAGHCYFTLKDAGAQIGAVLFAGSARTLGLAAEAITDGGLVRVEADLTVYEPRGQYQLVVRRVMPAGQGVLLARFEALKRQLLAEGLCDSSRKRPLPRLPRHVGVVTSPSGAAIRDILQVLRRRFPNLHIVLAPARVQGDGAAEEIADAIDRLNAHGGMDVLIVGRGGGSLEDLWAFNEEVVARAIVRSAIPVISAVGHEVDLTISDLVADLRAPTPSAAAELVVGRKDEFEAQLRDVSRTLARLMLSRTDVLRGRLDVVRTGGLFRDPRHALERSLQQVDALRMRLNERLRKHSDEARQRFAHAEHRLQAHRRGRFDTPRMQLDAAERRLRHATLDGLDRTRQRMQTAARQLAAFNPSAVLRRGYSLTMNAEGRLVRSIDQLASGDSIRTRLVDGEIESRVIAPKANPASPPDGGSA